MQIDFHHAVAYVVARMAGFDHRQGEVLAHASQYVDDAINAGPIGFDNGAMYNRTSSAHKTFDYRNFSDLANHYVWIPFHFLPGNGGRPAGDNPDGSFISKIVCQPDSPVAREMVNLCILHKKRPYGLHRLGIALHVYADTWAHQRFAGVCHRINHITQLDEQNRVDADFQDRLRHYFEEFCNNVVCDLVGDVMPLGHGAALSQPDKPFLTWRYLDHEGAVVERSNTDIFVQAAQAMCKAMQRFLAGDGAANVPGLTHAQRDLLGRWMADIQDEEGAARHKKWLALIRQGAFGFPGVKLVYKEKGEGSWKQQALGTTRKRDLNGQVFAYTPGFLTSDWKLFHDALLVHRYVVIHDILPRYGICVA